MKSRKTLGNLGENLAKGYIERLGYKILHAPFRCRIGEIDIIALNDDVLVFMEVKTRRNLRFGTPAEAVTRRKQLQIIKTAQHFLAHYRKPPFRFCRFDVLAIFQPKGAAPARIEHFQDAFRVDY